MALVETRPYEVTGQEWVGDADQRATLFKKIAKVLGEIDAIQKGGHANVQTKSGSNYSYSYVTEADLMTEVRGKLAEAEVAVFVSCDKQWDEGNLVRVQMALTFGCGEGGAMFTIKGQGAATDMGDKALYKAMTGCTRYMLWKTFLIPTGDEPDADHVPRQSQGPAQQRSQNDTRPITEGQVRLVMGKSREFGILDDNEQVWTDKVKEIVEVTTGGAATDVKEIQRSQLDKVIKALEAYSADPAAGDQIIDNFFEAKAAAGGGENG